MGEILVWGFGCYAMRGDAMMTTALQICDLFFIRWLLIRTLDNWLDYVGSVQARGICPKYSDCYVCSICSEKSCCEHNQYDEERRLCGVGAGTIGNFVVISFLFCGMNEKSSYLVVCKVKLSSMYFPSRWTGSYLISRIGNKHFVVVIKTLPGERKLHDHLLLLYHRYAATTVWNQLHIRDCSLEL
jgi:hypothetical protein